MVLFFVTSLGPLVPISRCLFVVGVATLPYYVILRYQLLVRAIHRNEALFILLQNRQFSKLAFCFGNRAHVAHVQKSV